MVSVPRRAVLGPRVAVNIVLKANQRTGKLTTGVISDILTKGDHPRGVKVRLESGQIGRVQSLAAAQPRPPTGVQEQVSSSDSTLNQYSLLQQRNYKFQDDFRRTEAPPANQAASLADYIKAPSRNKKKKGPASDSNTTSVTASADVNDLNAREVQPTSNQARLEMMFPNLDTALIAAILGDSSSIEEACEVLKSIS